MSVLTLGIAASERGLVPDAIIRRAIRRLCRQRLAQADAETKRLDPRRAEFLASLDAGPIAPLPEYANAQHYELPAEFFATFLGPRRKYSCCYFPDAETSLADAEAAALQITCDRAELADGQRILELGCGWGSLSLWMAENFPRSQITAVSNSGSQRGAIERQAARRRLENLRVVTADMNDFAYDGPPFDRIVSVEMFEHMRNYRRLLNRIAGWLAPQGKVFVHLFCHRTLSYPFETDGSANWMGQHFFTGGMMPSADLLRSIHSDLRVTRQYGWNGQHYQRTAEAWLTNLDANREAALEFLAGVYGPRQSPRWFQRWRIFLLAVAELFGYAKGQEWFVSHYVLEHAAQRARLSVANQS